MKKVEKSDNFEEYENVISLGYFCSVASEIERMGLRTHSGPFDWQACVDFKKRIELIDTWFKEFFENLINYVLLLEKFREIKLRGANSDDHVK